MTVTANGTPSASDLPPSNGGKPPGEDGGKTGESQGHTPPMGIVTIDNDHGQRGDTLNGSSTNTTITSTVINEKQQEQQVHQTSLSTFTNEITTQNNSNNGLNQFPSTNEIDMHVSKQKDWNEWLNQLPLQDKAHIFQWIGQSSMAPAWHDVDLQLNMLNTTKDPIMEEHSKKAQCNNNLVQENKLHKDVVANKNAAMEEDISKNSSCFEKVSTESWKEEMDDYSWEDDSQIEKNDKPGNVDLNGVQNEEDNLSMQDNSESNNSVGEVVGNYNPPNLDLSNNSEESSLGSEREPTRYSFYIIKTYTAQEMNNSKLDHNGWFKEIIKDVLEECMDDKLVSGVIQNDGKVITDLPASHNAYCAKPKIEERKKSTKFTTFVSVYALYLPSKLVKILRSRLQDINAWVSPKFSGAEYTKRIGFLSQVNTKMSSITWYTNTIRKMTKLCKGDIELRREKTWEKNYITYTYVVYAVESKASSLDRLLRSPTIMKQIKEMQFMYVSFKHTPNEILLKKLHTTNLLNRKMLSQTLYFTNVKDKVKNINTNQEGTVKQILLTVAISDGRKLFTGVEQGKPEGFFYDDAFVLFYPSMKREEEKWLEANWGTTFIVKNKDTNTYTHHGNYQDSTDNTYEEFITTSTNEIVFTTDEGNYKNYSKISTTYKEALVPVPPTEKQENNKVTIPVTEKVQTTSPEIQQLKQENKKLNERMDSISTQLSTVIQLMQKLVILQMGQSATFPINTNGNSTNPLTVLSNLSHPTTDRSNPNITQTQENNNNSTEEIKKPTQETDTDEDSFIPAVNKRRKNNKKQKSTGTYKRLRALKQKT